MRFKYGIVINRNKSFKITIIIFKIVRNYSNVKFKRVLK